MGQREYSCVCPRQTVLLGVQLPCLSLGQVLPQTPTLKRGCPLQGTVLRPGFLRGTGHAGRPGFSHMLCLDAVVVLRGGSVQPC